MNKLYSNSYLQYMLFASPHRIHKFQFFLYLCHYTSKFHEDIIYKFLISLQRRNLNFLLVLCQASSILTSLNVKGRYLKLKQKQIKKQHYLEPNSSTFVFSFVKSVSLISFLTFSIYFFRIVTLFNKLKCIFKEYI